MRFSMVFVYVGVDQNSLEVLVNAGVIPGREYTNYLSALECKLYFRFFCVASGNIIHYHI